MTGAGEMAAIPAYSEAGPVCSEAGGCTLRRPVAHTAKPYRRG